MNDIRSAETPGPEFVPEHQTPAERAKVLILGLAGYDIDEENLSEDDAFERDGLQEDLDDLLTGLTPGLRRSTLESARYSIQLDNLPGQNDSREERAKLIGLKAIDRAGMLLQDARHPDASQ